MHDFIISILEGLQFFKFHTAAVLVFIVGDIIVKWTLYA